VAENFRCRYILLTVTAEIPATSVAYLKKKKIQLSGFSSNPGGSPSHLILISGVLLYISGPGSSVSIVTDYGLDGPGSNPGGNEIFRPS